MGGAWSADPHSTNQPTLHLCFSSQSPLHLVGQQSAPKLLLLQPGPVQSQVLLGQLEGEVPGCRGGRWGGKSLLIKVLNHLATVRGDSPWNPDMVDVSVTWWLIEKQLYCVYVPYIYITV